MFVSLTTLRTLKVFFLFFILELGQVSDESAQAGSYDAVNFVIVGLAASLAVGVLLLFEFLKQQGADLFGHVEGKLGPHVVKDLLDIHVDLQEVAPLLD